MSEQWTNHIRYWRKLRKLSQEAVALALPEPTTKGTISQYESGKRTPSLEKVYQIAGVLECQPGELLDGPRDTPPIPSADELARMIQGAMNELPVGVSYEDYPQAVSSGLLDRLAQYQASGGFRQHGGEESARDTIAQPAPTTKRDGQEESHNQ